MRSPILVLLLASAAIITTSAPDTGGGRSLAEITSREGVSRLVELSRTAVAEPVFYPVASAPEPLTTLPIATVPEETRRIVLPALQGSARVGLSGFPSYGAIEFDVPVDVTHIDATLRLVVSTQLVETGSGLLRVAVDGRRRAEHVLERGRHTAHLDIRIPAEDLADGHLRVSLAAVGDAGGGACTSSRDAGIVVELTADSGLILEIADEPIASVRDAWALLPRPVMILRPEAGDDNGTVATLALATRLRQAGVPVEITGPDAIDARGGIVLVGGQGPSVRVLDPSPAAPVLGIRRDDADAAGLMLGSLLRDHALNEEERLVEAPAITAAGGAIDVLALLGDAGQRAGRGSVTWQVPLPLIRFAGSGRPSEAVLDLETAAGLPDSADIVTIRLNGRLVYSRTVEPGTVSRLAFPLPVETLRPASDLSISLQRVSGTPLPCPDLLPELAAAIGSGSHILTEPWPKHGAAGFAALPTAWAAGPIAITFDGPVGEESLQGLAIVLADLLPVGTRLAATTDPHEAVIRVGGSPDAAAAASELPILLDAMRGGLLLAIPGGRLAAAGDLGRLATGLDQPLSGGSRVVPPASLR